MDANFWVSVVSIAVLLTFAASAAAAGRWVEYLNRRMRILKRKSFAFYVETGCKTEAFSTLSRRAVKAAEKQRLAAVRTREFEIKPFQAECSCPSCTRVGLHWIEIGIPPGRECIYCGHKWRHR